MVPHWQRGAEDGDITAPTVAAAAPARARRHGRRRRRAASPRRSSSSTTGRSSRPRPTQVKGAIVVYDVAMPAWTEEHGSGYGETVQYRGRGASRAAKHGAVAALVRSVTARSLRTPHTGAMSYDDDAAEDPDRGAHRRGRRAARPARRARPGHGPPAARRSQTLPDAESANVIGELRGREKPDEIVVIGGHLDSWDVGQGAHDDGAGRRDDDAGAQRCCKQLGLAPRRTIRVVLFTERGERPARRQGATRADHAAELPKHRARDRVRQRRVRAARLRDRRRGAEARTARCARASATSRRCCAPLGVARGRRRARRRRHRADGGRRACRCSGSTSTTAPTSTIHHTEADTLDKVDPAQLADDVAAVAVLAYVVADMPDRSIAVPTRP